MRSCVRNRFLASCWVSVEPPCDDAAMQHVRGDRAQRCRTDRRRNANRSAGPRSRGTPSAGTAGSSRSGTAAPPISPRVASTRPLRPTIWIEGGRFGTSSDWIGGRCAATQPITPMRADERPQRRARATSRRTRPISERRLPLLPLLLARFAGSARRLRIAGSRRSSLCRLPPYAPLARLRVRGDSPCGARYACGAI